jgi:hypothetical protein
MTNNCYLQRELDMLKHERTRETWLLKNDLQNLEKANSRLQKQLEEQQMAHQEQLKEQKKAHQGKPLLPSSTFPYRVSLDTENIFTAELSKILKYKKELLTDVKNILYRRTDDIERLQKVATDTEEQFADCLWQIKMLGEEKGRREKELEILKEAT